MNKVKCWKSFVGFFPKHQVWEPFIVVETYYFVFKRHQRKMTNDDYFGFLHFKGHEIQGKENVRMPKNKINSNDCKVGIL